MKDYQNKETLNNLYHEQGLTSTEIGNMFGVTRGCICQWMRKLGVEARSPSERANTTWSEERKQAARELMTDDKNPMFGVKTSDEVKAKQSKSKLGDKNPNYGKKFSKEHKQKIGEAQLGEKNHQFGLRGKLSKQSGKKHTQATKDKISKLHRGRMPSHLVSRGKGGRFIDRKGRTFYLRSSWELAFAEWLDEREYTWNYECKRFDLGYCTYTPDFWVVEMGGWIEIKGYYDEASEKKTMTFRELYPEENLIIATKKVLALYPALNI